MVTKFHLTRCQLLPDGNAIKINIKGEIPQNLNDLLTKFQEVKDVLSTLTLKAWEKIVITGTEVVRKIKNFIQIVLTFKKEPIPFRELSFHGISHTGNEEVNLRLRQTNREGAAQTAAEYALRNELPAVTARYKHGVVESFVKVVNYNIYKKDIRPGQISVFERFVGQTGCLLLR